MTSAALKKTMKAALVEVIRENRELVASVVAEAIEDAGVAAAIREGEKSKRVSRQSVMRILRGKK